MVLKIKKKKVQQFKNKLEEGGISFFSGTNSVTILLFTYHLLHQGVKKELSEILVISTIHFMKLLAQNMQYKVRDKT